MSDVRCQRSDVRGQMSEVRGQRSEVRGQRLDAVIPAKAGIQFIGRGEHSEAWREPRRFGFCEGAKKKSPLFQRGCRRSRRGFVVQRRRSW
ncbi:MAG: hypothetical protein FWC38_08300 [Proteobacteria bacterium]|nr:hypothetical protein [Pseudomonadota bacterium]